MRYLCTAMSHVASRAQGYTAAIVSAFTFGLIPLFSVPVLAHGMSASTVLMYRFLFATVAMGLYAAARRIRLALSLRRLGSLLVLSLLYFITAQLLLSAYEYISSGMATVLHFTYPIFVALLMRVFFRVRLSKRGTAAIMAAVAGVSLVSGVTSPETVNPEGPVLVITSGFTYAVYIILVRKSGLEGMGHEALTFYILLITASFLTLYSLLGRQATLPAEPVDWVRLALLGLLSTAVSNITLVQAIDRIGSTPTAVMGAIEPLTAVMTGVAAFGEELTPIRMLGIGMILAAVVLLTSEGKR